MNKELTELVFILDRSGSMSGLESDTIGGFNGMIRKQKKLPGSAYVSTVLFNHCSQVLHDRVDLAQIGEMTEEDYVAGGSTALIDAMGDAITHIGNVHKYAREEDRPFKTVFVIITDGEENSSKRWSSQKVKDLITRQKEKYGWEFLFLGANIDAVETAARYGIEEDRSVTFRNDPVGQALNYEAIEGAVSCMRGGGDLSCNWKKAVRKYQADHQKD